MPLDLSDYSSFRSTNCIHSDTPILEDPPWPDLWKGLFSSDSDTFNIHFGLSEDETTNVAVWDAEGSIETWAAQDLLWSQTLSAPSEATNGGISFEEPTTTPSEELCYGMVCYYTRSRNFFTRFSVICKHGLIAVADISCSCKAHRRHVRSRIQTQLGDYVPGYWAVVIRHNEVHSSPLSDIS